MRVRHYVIAGLIILLGAVFIVPGSGILIGTFGGNGGASACVTSVTQGIGPTGHAPVSDSFFQAVDTDGHGNNRVILGMLEGSQLESGQSNEIVAGAYGYFQIQNPGLDPNPNVTIAEALNPAWSTNYMYPRYLAALNTVNPGVWKSNPEAAGEQDAFAAEHPTVNYYLGQSPANVHAAFLIAIQEMQAMHISTNFGAGVVTTAVGGPGCNATLPSDAKGLRLIVLKAAASQLGDPYVWGGTTPKDPSTGFPGAFDCSGLVMWSFQHAKIYLPRVSGDQWFFTISHTVTTNFADIEKLAVPGDLIFFAGADGTLTDPGHVAIYWGHGDMLAAPQTGEDVQIQPIPTTIGFVGVTDPYYLAAGQGNAAQRGNPQAKP